MTLPLELNDSTLSSSCLKAVFTPEYVAYSLRGCSQPSFPLRKAVQRSTLVAGHSRTSSKLTLESWHSQRLEHGMMPESCSASEHATYSLRFQSLPMRRRRKSRVVLRVQICWKKSLACHGLRTRTSSKWVLKSRPTLRQCTIPHYRLKLWSEKVVL